MFRMWCVDAVDVVYTCVVEMYSTNKKKEKKLKEKKGNHASFIIDSECSP